MIPDIRSGEMIHTMSSVETDLYYIIAWNPEVKEIHSQVGMDMEEVNEIRESLDLKKVSPIIQYSTDFVVYYKDMDTALDVYSVKATREQFNSRNRKFHDNKQNYTNLIYRQAIEKIYWERRGARFNIVTSEDIDKGLAANIRLVLGYYDHSFVVNEAQKFLYLVAHQYIHVPLDRGPLRPNKILSALPNIDINSIYEKVRSIEEGKH